MSPACPSDSELLRLLGETDRNSGDPALEGHMEQCAACRQRLETLAGAARIASGLHTLRQSGQGEEMPGLETFLQNRPPRSEGCTSGPLDPASILHLLAPSGQEGILGTFGIYEILEVVAAGGMGIVLRARNSVLKRVVALKVLPPVLAADADWRERFDREARSVAAIESDHVVRVYAAGTHQSIPFIEMEFVDGESLSRKLEREERLGISNAIRIAREVATGLAAAHQRGIIHRDIKPANVLLEAATGRAKITDFGLARDLADPGVTRNGLIVGTPEYLSPEQAAGEKLDERSDLFSLGCLLFALCAGESPFRGKTTLEVLRKVADAPPPALHLTNREVPLWLGALVERLLAKNPADRFESAEQLIDRLDDGPAGLPAGNNRASLRVSFRLLFPVAVLAVVIPLGILAATHFKTLRKPFVVRQANRALTGFTNLQEAVDAAPAGSAIELRWNGEREIPPITLPARSLVLKAGAGKKPVWLYRAAKDPAVTAMNSLRLESLRFRLLASAPDVPAGERRFGEARPSGPKSLILARRGTLIISGCFFERAAPLLDTDDEYAAITLFEGMTNCSLADSAVLLRAGKGIVCRSLPALTISNCLFFASQAIWMDPAPAAPGKVRIEKTSIKGGIVLLFPPRAHPFPIQIDAASSLFNTTFLIVDQRRDADTFLPATLTWNDRSNLYSILSHDGLRGGLIRFHEPPGVVGPLLSDWQSFSGQKCDTSFEARAHFAKVREPGGASWTELPRIADFQLESLEPVPNGRPLPSPSGLIPTFGPNLKSFEAF